MGLHLFEPQLLHRPPYLHRAEPHRGEAGTDLRGRQVAALLERRGAAVVGQDELAGGIGRFETAVAAIERLHLVALEPVTETTVEQGLGLCIDTPS